MSKFAIEDARRLAALTFRFREDKFASPEEQLEAGEVQQPLIGKEDELLAALRAGERRYDLCRQEIAVLRDLRNSDRALPQYCAQFAHTLDGVRRELSSLSELMRGELDSIAQYQGSSAAEMHARIDALIGWFQKGACNPASFERKKAGKKRGKSNTGVDRPPLEEFAKEIRKLLISPAVGMHFGFQDEVRAESKTRSRNLLSPAARLIYEAARLLDRRVDFPDIKIVMKAVRRHPEFREELLDDPVVDALTN